MLQPGTLINGRYRVVRTIGSGGMGSVFAAHDERLGRQVALKLLRPDLASDQRARERFLREAQIAAQLVHPNIVRTYDVGDAPEGPYLVQELLDGRTLDTLLPLPSRRALGVTEAIADALGYIHGQGYVHCDIKPQNIMLVGQGAAERVVLLDFGIARVEGTATTTLIATPHYLAPELAMGSPPAAASDWYAVGIVLFQMLADHPPFDGPTLHTIIEQHRIAPLPPLKLALGGTAQETTALEAIIRKLTAKQPDERYGSASALKQDLANVRAGAIHAMPTMVVAKQTPAPAPQAVFTPPPALDRATAPSAPARQAAYTAPSAPAIVKTAGPRLNPRLLLLAVPLLALLLGGAALIQARSARQNAPQRPDVPIASEAPTAPSLSTVAVPDILNRPVGEAEQLLAQAGLVLVPGGAIQSEQAANTVLTANPVPGVPVAPGTQVVVQVSAGPPPPVVQPPSNGNSEQGPGRGNGKEKDKGPGKDKHKDKGPGKDKDD
ncbi:MAG: protein kinase [Chloroflexi bacterium]|nr:protein kinase [Chloroflexota bacterium]